MENNIKIIEENKVNDKCNFYVSRINKKISWPPNSMLVYFVCQEKNFNLQKAMKSYKILIDGSENTKIVSITKPACEIYDSKRS